MFRSLMISVCHQVQLLLCPDDQLAPVCDASPSHRYHIKTRLQVTDFNFDRFLALPHLLYAPSRKIAEHDQHGFFPATQAQ